MSDESIKQTIAILGGTGNEGKGLAYRWAKVGFHVIIGSRNPKKALSTAEELSIRLGGRAFIDGTSNLDAAKRADIVVLTIPYPFHQITLESVRSVLKGKILVDVTVPLVPPKITIVQMPSAGSAAQEACQVLGNNTEVVSAFHTISYKQLLTEHSIESEVLVCGTSKHAREKVLNLVTAAGLIGWDAGPVENSVVLEGLTSVLIGINREYGGTHAGIKITGAGE